MRTDVPDIPLTVRQPARCGFARPIEELMGHGLEIVKRTERNEDAS